MGKQIFVLFEDFERGRFEFDRDWEKQILSDRQLGVDSLNHSFKQNSFVSRVLVHHDQRIFHRRNNVEPRELIEPAGHRRGVFVFSLCNFLGDPFRPCFS